MLGGLQPVTSKWVRCYRPRPAAKLRLVCIPFAGGGASVFRLWADALPTSVELLAVQLPGREERLAEPLISSRTVLARALTDELAPLLTEPFVLFGHSMGARLAFEVARELRARNARGPEHLIVSGRGAPHLASTRTVPRSELPHDEFLDVVRRMNGTPKEVFDEPELLELVLPILRADFSINDREPHLEQPPFACPITALRGVDDDQVSEDRLAAWRTHTNGPFAQYTFPGDHFYLMPGRAALLEVLSAIVARHVP